MHLHFRHRLMQAALVVSILAVGWAVTVLVTGGISAELGGLRISSRHALNPVIVACFAAISAFALATVEERRRAWPAFVSVISGDASERVAAGVVIIAVVAVVSFGLAKGLFVAGASDAYGYVSQADLWARGDVIVRQPWARDMTWPNADNALAPLGYRPHRPAPHGTDIVPTYAPGVPMLMAVFSLIVGPRAVYYVVPLLGGLAVWATFAMGRRLAGPFVGASAAVLLATSPTFLFEITAPASDVAATAWWALALLALLYESRRAALASGAATGMAILTRPNLVPLAIVLVAPIAWQAIGPSSSPDDRRRAFVRLLLFAAGSVPACAVIAVLNWRLYGSPLMSGYGSLDHIYAWSHIWANLARYPRWLVETQTPIVVLAAVAPFLLKRGPESGGAARPRSSAVMWLGAIFGIFGLYLFYVPFDEWWYLRFLMPMLPPLLVLTSAVIVRATTRMAPIGRGILTAALVGVIAWHDLRLAIDRGAHEVRDAEQRYIAAGTYVRAELPERAALLSMNHSGSARFYSGRITVRYDQIQPTDLERVLGDLQRLGYRPYFLLDEFEEEPFRRRFADASPLGALDWAPKAVMYRRLVRIYDPAERRQ